MIKINAGEPQNSLNKLFKQIILRLSRKIRSFRSIPKIIEKFFNGEEGPKN